MTTTEKFTFAAILAATLTFGMSASAAKKCPPGAICQVTTGGGGGSIVGSCTSGKGKYSFHSTTGDNQTGTVGEKLPYRATVTVKDFDCNPVPGVDVTFSAYTVTPGWVGQVDNAGAFVNSLTVTADGSGTASANLVLGPLAGTTEYWWEVTTSERKVEDSPIYFSALAKAGPATALKLSGLISPAGLATNETEVPQTVIVRAEDKYGNLASSTQYPYEGYEGTVSFSYSPSVPGEPAAIVFTPPSYTFLASDKATKSFDIGFRQRGDWTLRVADIANGALFGEATVSIVEPVASWAFATGSSEIQQVQQVSVHTTESVEVEVQDKDTGAIGSGVVVSWVLKNLATGNETSLGSTTTGANGVAIVDVPFGDVAGVNYSLVASLSNGDTQTLSYVTTPGPTTNLVPLYVTTQKAGVPVNLYFLAKDDYDNLTPNYAGMLQLAAFDVDETTSGESTSLDGVVAADAAYATANDNDPGTVDFFPFLNAATFTSAGLKRLRVTTNDTPAIVRDIDLVVEAAAATTLVVAPELAGTQSMTAGSPLSLSVEAHDDFGNLALTYEEFVTLSATDGSAQLPAAQTLVGGAGNFDVVLTSAGIHTVTVDGAGGVTAGQWSVQVTPAAIDDVVVVAGQDQVGEAGALLGSPLQVRLIDAFGNGIAGTQVQWSVAAGGGVVETAVTLSNAEGVASTNARVGTDASSAQTFSAYVAVLGKTLSFQAQAVPGSAASLQVVNSVSEVVSGDLATITLVVRDSYGNTVSDYTGTWSLASSDGLSASRSIDIVAADAGERTVEIALYEAGMQSVVIDDGTLLPVSIEVWVKPGAPASVAVLSGDNQTAMVQSALPQPLVVRVGDAAGNGVGGVEVSWTAGGNANVASTTVTDTDGNSAVTGVLGTLVVDGGYVFTATVAGLTEVSFVATATPSAADSVEVSGIAGGRPLGSALDVQLRLFDRFQNLATGYRGTVRFTSDDAAATLPAPFTFGEAHQGVATLKGALQFGTEGSFTITVTDAADASVVGVSEGIEVAPRPAPGSLAKVSGDGQSTTVATPYDAPLVVRVLTAQGDPLSGIEVNFQSSEGTVGEVVVSDAGGLAATTPTAGTKAGGEQYVAVIPGLPPVSFGATAVAGPVANLVATVPAGSSVEACGEEVFTLLGHDAYGNPSVVPVELTFSATSDAGEAFLTQSNFLSGLPAASATGTMTGAGQLHVSLQAAGTLTLAWSAPGQPSFGNTHVEFLQGPADKEASSLTADAFAAVADGTPVTLHVVPRDGCGLPLGPGHEVVLETSYGTVGAAVFDGTEGWDAPFTIGPESCEAAPAALRAVVDGIRLIDEVLIVTHCPVPVAEGVPVILETANPVAVVGIAYRYDDDRRLFAQSDTPVTWSLLEGPEGFSVDHSTGFVGWVPVAAGETSISVGATNELGTTVYTFVVDVLSGAPGAPVAIFDVTPSQTRAGLLVEGDASASTPAPGGTLLGWKWDFGDGSPILSGVQVEHRYLMPGNYVVRVEVVDAFGLVAQAARDVRISNDAGDLPPSVHILSAMSEDPSGTMVDLSCDCEEGSSPLAGYLWDFGDGSSVDGSTTSRRFAPGQHEVRLLVVDEEGLASSDEIVIRVEDNGQRPPLLTASASPTAGMAPLAVQLAATAQDLNGENVSLRWDFGDGGSSTEVSPAYVFETPGYYRVAVTATDEGGLATTSVLEVSVTDDGGLLPPQFLSSPQLSAQEGAAYRYDEDGKPAVRGGRPLTFELGKMVGSVRTGAPAGMTVDPYSGELLWTPSVGQAGTHPVTLVAWNAAGIRTQEFEIVVAAGLTPGPGTNGGPTVDQGSSPDGQAPGAGSDAVPATVSGCAALNHRSGWEVSLLALLLAVPRRRRLRRARDNRVD